ncbi:uncharacterized protein ACBR49_001263 [Aulostomus maculatus]
MCLLSLTHGKTRACGHGPGCPPSGLENTQEEAENGLLKPHGEVKLPSTEEVLYRGVTQWQQRGVDRVALPEDGCDQEEVVSNRKTSSCDENESNEGRNAACFVSEGRDGQEFLYSKEKAQRQTRDPGVGAEPETSVGVQINTEQKSKEPVHDQIKREGADKVENGSSHVLGYFAGKLSEAYRDAGKRLQDTRHVIRNVGVGEMKVLLSQYATMVSKELPLLHRLQLPPKPEPCVLAEDKILLKVSKECSFSLPQNLDTPRGSGWPEGSVASLKHRRPEVFHQRLVQLPPALSQLQTFSSQEILEKLESLAPQIRKLKLQNIFWLNAANSRQPRPQPGCLLLFEKDLVVVSTGADSDDTLVIFHHYNLQEIKEIQVSLAGQHVRLMGCTEGIVLVVFTHSKELTQELCKAFLKTLAPETLSEWTEAHPLLTDDLMVLSLDWTARVPDVSLDNGLHLTSRFKRVLADLLYIVHGNMSGPDKPSLADICPLLYTSVKVKSSTRVHQDAIVQLLLTDTHVALLQEDGVFHPVPRGSSFVPVQPQFQGLELRPRSDIRCLTVRQSDNCLVVDVVFKTHPPTAGDKMAVGRGSDEGYPCDSWRLCFGSPSEAVMLVRHLCT